MRKFLTLSIAFILIFGALFSCGVVLAAPKGATVEVDNLILGVGADESERTLNWYSKSAAYTTVKVAPYDRLVGGEFPTDAKTYDVTSKDSKTRDGYFVKRATITDLQPDTRYAYAIFEGDGVSEIYSFSTSKNDEFTFAFVGDPQISSEQHGTSWRDTVDKIINEFETELIISAGDQITTHDSQAHFDYFAVDNLPLITFAPTAGPNHDVEPNDDYGTYAEHYNVPNLSTEYGAKGGAANYWFVYNNILFMNLNMCDTSAATNGEHRAFMEEAIAANPGIKWRIVVMHSSLFSTGMHGDPNYQYYDSEIGRFRPALAPMFTEFGIDVVLSGHDHVYLRTQMMDGEDICDTDVVTSNTVTDPDGTLYVCANSSTGSKFYNKLFDADFTACENYENRKSAIKFDVTSSTLRMTSYFLDDMTEFDTFTITKEHLTCTLTKHEAVPVECEKDGSREYYYCKCGRAYEDEQGTTLIENVKEWATIPQAGHDWMGATCTTPKTCKDCGATEGRSQGHSWSFGTCASPMTCSGCDATRTIPHKFSAATCEAPKTCKDCGATEGDPLPHTPTEATCTEGSECSACGESLSSPLGHTASDPTCTEGSVCSVCGETVEDPLGHDFSYPSCTENEVCTRCGAEGVAAPGHSYDSDSDAVCNICSYEREIADEDKDNYVIIIAVVAAGALLFGAGAFFTVRHFKKKRDK